VSYFHLYKKVTKHRITKQKSNKLPANTSPSKYVLVWVEPSRKGNQEPDGHQYQSFKPVRLSITNGVVDNKDRDEHNNSFENVKDCGQRTLVEPETENGGHSHKLKGFPIIQARITKKGRTNKAI